MNIETKTAEYMKKMESVKLSDSSRARIEKNLLDYARFHSVVEGVREGEPGRSIEQVPQRASLFSLRYSFMPFIILLAVVVGGGTSFAAQGAAPGDLLYAVKTEINEPVRSAFTFSASAEAELQADIVAERVVEAEALKAKGELEGEVASKLSASIKAHAAKADKASAKSDESVRANTSAKLSLAVKRFNVLVENDTALALSTQLFGADGQSELDVTVGTSMVAGKINPEQLQAQTKARVEGLVEVVEKYEADISAEVYTSLTAKLDTASELMVTSMTQAEVESQQSVMRAAELAGEVESKLSTLGTVEINQNTGAIVDIDFSIVPPLELNVGGGSASVLPVASEEIPTTTGDLEVDGVIETDIDLETSVIELDADESVRSGLNI